MNKTVPSSLSSTPQTLPNRTTLSAIRYRKHELYVICWAKFVPRISFERECRVRLRLVRMIVEAAPRTQFDWSRTTTSELIEFSQLKLILFYVDCLVITILCLL